MKKIYTMLMMVMMAVAFTSCEDAEVARTLEGTWRGNMYISTSYGGRTYNATETEVTFLRDPYAYSSGTGYWVDYYSTAPWDYVANHIEWRVDYGVIYVYFVEENTEIRISDYRLNGSTFYGTINDNGRPVDFELYYYSRPAGYYNGLRWGYDYWTRTRGASDSTNVEKPVRFVNPDLKVVE